MLTRGDTNRLEPLLRHVKEVSPTRGDRQIAADILFKLDRINWRPEDEVSTAHQISLKQSELKLIGALRDTNNVQLDYLSAWHIPQEG
jgi:hypothetical protein